MTDEVPLSELVVEAAHRGSVPASETWLFLALQIIEALRNTPLRVAPNDVRVTSEGTVSIAGSARPGATESECVTAIVAIIDAIISPLPADVDALVERAHRSPNATLATLHAEVEALLVPLNRAAARRLLGRLVRDHQRYVRTSGASATATLSDAPATSMAPNSVPVSSEPGYATGSADATVQDNGSVGDTYPERFESMPPIPPPPRLGSLASMTIASSTRDHSTEPFDRHSALAGNATDTERDSHSFPGQITKPPWLPRVAQRIILAAVAILVFAAIVFLAYALGTMRA